MVRLLQQGFNALELIVTMAIVAILLAAAVPSFKQHGWNLRMKTAMDMLQTDINLARSYAVSHGVQTVVCPAGAITGCAGISDWQDGWIVFTDITGDQQRQDSEPLLKQAGATEFLAIQSSRSRTHLRFSPNGTAPGSNMTILFCDQRGAQHAGKIIVSSSGRIRQETSGTESSGNCP